MSSDTDTRTLEEKLKESSYRLKWSEINSGILKEVIILVGQDLDLGKVGLACANDEKELFEAWLDQGKIVRSGSVHHENWNELNPFFDCCIVKPFIFIKKVKVVKS